MFAKKSSKVPAANSEGINPWKVIIVDDEPLVHDLTKMVLRHFEYLGRKIQFLSAYSGEEAKEVCKQHTDAELILLDVIMEEDDSGLQLARYVREDLSNYMTRIVLRTGQSGKAPERQVILDYDINDYKEKTELTKEKLFTTIVSSLRSYEGLHRIEMQRRELQIIKEHLEKEILVRRQAEQAIQKREARLRKHNRIILDLARRKVSNLDNLTSTLEQIAEATTSAVDVERVGVWFYNEDRSMLVCKNLYESHSQQHMSDLEWTVGPEYREYLQRLEENRTVAINDILTEPVFPPLWELPLVSPQSTALIDVAIRQQNQMVGLLRLEHVPQGREWAVEEENFAGCMADFVSLALFNLDLEKHIRDNVRMESELQTAAAVQKALLPRSLPSVPELEFASFFQSAHETGGDWYGFMDHFENSLFVLIGDVTGHGTPAALITATASAANKALEEVFSFEHHTPSPAEILTYLNHIVCATGAPDFLMTFFVARIDYNTGLMTFCNAGHNFPILLQPDGHLRHLLNRNTPLGHSPDQTYTETSLSLAPQDTLVFYTDGLIENTNPEKEMWGIKNFRLYLKEYIQQSVQELISGLIDQAQSFYKDQALADDYTVLACRMTDQFGKPRE